MAGSTSTDTKILVIKLSSSSSHAWWGKEETYDGIASDVGVTAYEPGSSSIPKEITFGSDLKPPRINIRTTDGKSFSRSIAPDKIEAFVFDKGWAGKKLNGKDICYVSMKSN